MKAEVILERFRKQDDNESEARPSTPLPKDWRQMNRLVRAVVKDTSAETSQKLSQTLTVPVGSSGRDGTSTCRPTQTGSCSRTLSGRQATMSQS
jgi:hypothetical protein